MRVRLRPLRPEDLRSVLAIEEASFPRPWSEGMFAAELGLPDRMWFVAERDGEVVGYAGAMMQLGEAHVMNLAVAAGARRQGVATVLLSGLIDALRDRGAHGVTLEVRENNDAAISLYESAGMHAVGERPGYYVETGESAVVMWSDDLDSPGMNARLDILRARARRYSYASDDDGHPYVLGIETSCDETAAAVVGAHNEVIANVVATQVDFHARFGGVVPEIASRKHTEAIVAVVSEALTQAAGTLGRPFGFDDVDAIAVTRGPGLVGALVVGLAYAKGLSLATGIPLIGINHLEAHIFAALLEDPNLAPPLIALVVSGGHTSLVYVPEWGEYRVLGETLDDAAGEAFDKVAKALGLGYPGGPIISRLAEQGDPAAIEFPRAMLHSGDYSFSLSGLKTAVINHVSHEREAGRELHLPDLAASFQAAVIDVQVAKAVRAAEEYRVSSFVIAGGVAANTALRQGLTDAMRSRGIEVAVPALHMCTDNAAMVATAGLFRYARGERMSRADDAAPGLRLDSA